MNADLLYTTAAGMIAIVMLFLDNRKSNNETIMITKTKSPIIDYTSKQFVVKKYEITGSSFTVKVCLYSFGHVVRLRPIARAISSVRSDIVSECEAVHVRSKETPMIQIFPQVFSCS